MLKLLSKNMGQQMQRNIKKNMKKCASFHRGMANLAFTKPPLLQESRLTCGKCSDTGYIYITFSWQVFIFPILQSPHDVALIFRTCQLHTAWELLHENGGSEHQAVGPAGHSAAVT